MIPDADADVAAAVAAAFAAVLADKDVVELGAVEGGLLEVVRRGRRERLSVVVEGPLFSLLRERGAEVDVVELRLSGGHRLVAAPLVDGRVAVRVTKPAGVDLRFEQLVEEGLLPPGVGEELVAAVLEGHGVGVVGPSRSGRARLVAALAKAVASTLRCTTLGDDVPAGCVPAPAVAHLVARARTAVALGADVVVAVELSAREAADLAQNGPGTPVVAGVAVPTATALAIAANEKLVPGLFPVVAVVAWAPDGRPRLLELHGPSPSAPAPTTPSSAASTTPASMAAMAPITKNTEAVAATAPRSMSAPTATGAAAPLTPVDMHVPARASSTARAAHPVVVDGVPELGEAPPADWASADADDDPGWELGSLAGDARPASAPGAFDAALAAAARRPAFQPRPPTSHPQMAALRGTGGLTFEPPGPTGGDDGGYDDGSDDEGSDEDGGAT